jgi:uncharacterized protein YgiB involved in biofilm formation
VASSESGWSPVVAAYNLNQMISETLDWLDNYLGTVE